MSRIFMEETNGYQDSIRRGIEAVRGMGYSVSHGLGTREERLERLAREIETADAIVIGAGAGLSTAAGYTYSGERFDTWFFDFAETYGFRDMYSGGFYPFPSEEERWAFWARNIYINRYLPPLRPVYEKLHALVEGRDSFVITTNVDHCFQRAGFDKKRLFYTQGDYGLFQEADGKLPETWDNEDWVMQAMEAQGFVRDEAGVFHVPADRKLAMRIPSELIPRSPRGRAVSMNLRADDSFVEDAGWHRASAAYANFLRRHEGLHLLFLELGVGNNTPVIIKYPFWAMTAENPKAVYACLNRSKAVCPRRIEAQSICLEGDSSAILNELTNKIEKK